MVTLVPLSYAVPPPPPPPWIEKRPRRWNQRRETGPLWWCYPTLLHREEGYSRTPGPSQVVLRLTIKFTVELEKDGTLAFLDTLLRRNDDGSLDVTIYRKPVHTDWYLNIQPRHPSHVKRGLVLCLYDRAKSTTISRTTYGRTITSLRF